jgi:basic membrane protein A
MGSAALVYRWDGASLTQAAAVSAPDAGAHSPKASMPAATTAPAAGRARLAGRRSHHAADILRHRCDLIASTSLAERIIDPAARRHPSQKFLLLDPSVTPSLPNVLGLGFNVNQSAFLAGYVSKTGRVATFGAVPINTVTPYMDGFAAGVERYDKDQHADVRVLGWDPRTQRGSFIAQAGVSAFSGPAAARRLAENFISDCADILFPVAGPASLGAGGGCQSAPRRPRRGGGFRPVLPGTPVRGPVAHERAQALRHGGGGRDAARPGEAVSRRRSLFTVTLANGGVDIAPFHDLDGRVPTRVKTRVPALEKGIADGSIRTGPVPG